MRHVFYNLCHPSQPFYEQLSIMEVFYCLIFFYFLAKLLFDFSASHSTRFRKTQCAVYGGTAWLVMALRSPQNGIDMKGYLPMFEHISRFSFEDALTREVMNYEQGYVVFNKLASLLSDNIQYFIVLNAAIIILIVSHIIYRYSTNIFLSFLIFVSFGCYTLCFSGLRQALAIALIFWSFKYLTGNKPLKFAATVLVASTFHTSALIFGIMWFVKNIRLTFSRGLGALLVYSILVLPFLKVLLPIISSGVFDDKYSSYGSDEGGAITMAVVYSFVFLGSYLLTKNDARPIINTYRWAILFAAFFQFLGLVSQGAITRMAFYFSIFFCLFIPAVLSNINSQTRPYINTTAAILFAIFFLITISSGYLNIVPYHFFWEYGWQNPLPLSY